MKGFTRKGRYKMTEERKQYDYLEYGKIEDGKHFVDVIGFISANRVYNRKGGVRSFGIPLQNVQGTVASMFPDDFTKEELPETVWANVVMFNSDKLGDKFTEAIDGKERIRVRVTGIARVDEYKGNKSVEVVAEDFTILWDNNTKGTQISGVKDEESYLVGKAIEKGKGFMAVEGFVSRPELREMSDGKKVLNFGIAANQASDEIKKTLSTAIEGEPTWINVSVFDNDYFAEAEQAAQVIRTGAAIAGLGFAQVEEYEGVERVNLTLNGFEMLKFAKKEGEDEEAGVGVGAFSEDFEESPFESESEFEYDDDDLPF